MTNVGFGIAWKDFIPVFLKTKIMSELFNNLLGQVHSLLAKVIRFVLVAPRGIIRSVYKF